jgi:hypothetical protein
MAIPKLLIFNILVRVKASVQYRHYADLLCLPFELNPEI